MGDTPVVELKIRFFLRIKGEFYSEHRVLENLPELVKLAKKGKIDLYTTEGAISILNGNVELLGVEFWDEINQFCRGLVYQLGKLAENKVVEEFMPLQTCYVRLRPVGDEIQYELESKSALRPLHVKQIIPRSNFLLEYLLMYLRLTKVLAALGSRSFSEEANQWEQSLPDFADRLLDHASRGQLTRAARSSLGNLIIPE